MKSGKLMRAIRFAIDEAELCYQFTPGHYAMSVLNAVLAIEQIYLAEQLKPEQVEPEPLPCIAGETT